ALALQCLSRPCNVAPEEPPEDRRPSTCDPTAETLRSSRKGLEFDYGTGWQTSAQPADGRVWSLGLVGRYRLSNRVGLVARVDHSRGRDAAIDNNGDGRDDIYTGLVTRWTALAGPSVVLAMALGDDYVRYVQLDTLAGYLWSRNSGPAFGFDL